eukprot:scaffold3109_cov52-Prasinocladus_malaysianus.AAC.1
MVCWRQQLALECGGGDRHWRYAWRFTSQSNSLQSVALQPFACDNMTGIMQCGDRYVLPGSNSLQQLPLLVCIDRDGVINK